MNKQPPSTGATVFRNTQIETPDANESGAITLSVSSELPVLRSFGYEVLKHTSDAVDLSRMNAGASVRNEHDGPLVGVVDSAALDGKKLRAAIRFSSSPEAQVIARDVANKIRPNVSLGYKIHEFDKPKVRPEINGIPVFTATRWEPVHLALVADPADHTVGFNRADAGFTLTPEQIALLQQIIANATTPTPDEVVADAVEVIAQVITDSVADALCIADDTTTPDATVQDERAEELADAPPVADTTTTTSAESETSPELDSDSVVARSLESSPVKDNTNDITIAPNVAGVTLTQNETRRYSVLSALTAKPGENTFEREISQTIAKNVGDIRGGDEYSFYMPSNMKRAWSISDANGGGGVTMTQPGDFVDFLRAKTIGGVAGCTFLTLNGKTALPVLGADQVANWVAEDGSAISPFSASISQVTLSPKKILSATTVSRETLAVASYDVESILTNNIYRSTATAIDKAIWQGTGTNQPIGITNLTGLVSGSNTSAITYAGCVELYGIVGAANADFGSMKYVTTPTLKSKCMSTIRSGSTAQFICTDDQKISLYDVLASSNVPSGYMIFGNFEDVLVADFGAVAVLPNPYSLARQGLVELVLYALADVQVRHAASFAVNKSLT